LYGETLPKTVSFSLYNYSGLKSLNNLTLLFFCGRGRLSYANCVFVFLEVRDFSSGGAKCASVP